MNKMPRIETILFSPVKPIENVWSLELKDGRRYVAQCFIPPESPQGFMMQSFEQNGAFVAKAEKLENGKYKIIEVIRGSLVERLN